MVGNRICGQSSFLGSPTWDKTFGCRHLSDAFVEVRGITESTRSSNAGPSLQRRVLLPLDGKGAIPFVIWDEGRSLLPIFASNSIQVPVAD